MTQSNTPQKQKKYPHLGFGLGLRKEHYQDVIDHHPAVDWFEILTENYLVDGGKPLYFLQQIAERYPLVMHGVSMNIGNTEALDSDYLSRIKQLKQSVHAHWLSDHLCWTGTNGTNAHDLLPLPYTEESIRHVAQRITQVQDVLGCRMLIENVSSYISYKQSEMTEWEFLCEIAQRADCLLLLDINNIYVSAVNHEFDPMDYINAIDPQRVQQFHLAGHSDYGDYIIDTHDEPVCRAVWHLYAQAVARFGATTFMIERDANIPAFEELMTELNVAKKIAATVMKEGYQSQMIQAILDKQQVLPPLADSQASDTLAL